jgi:hypothetical protein
MSRSPLAVAREALRADTDSSPAYSSARSRHDHTQPQLFAALALKQFLKTDHRGVAATLADSTDLRRALGLGKGPHYSATAYAARRLPQKGASSGPSRRPPRAPAMAG